MLDKLLNWIAHNMFNKDFMIIETVHTGNVDLSNKKYQTINIKPPKMEGYEPFGIVGWAVDRYYLQVVTARKIEKDGSYDIMIRALESVPELNAGARISFGYFRVI